MRILTTEKLTLGLILVIAAVVRLWNFPAYFPHFWDEARYLSEVESLSPYFSVNVGAFVFLKLGYIIFGMPSYPQIIMGLFGVLTVGGCYILGQRILRRERKGVFLGLLMAGQAAVMPYFIHFSRHALAAGFALCFLVYALYFYVARLQHPRVEKSKNRKKYLWCSFIAVGLLAMVPACSFKFLLPTLILFVAVEIFFWRERKIKHRDYQPARNSVLTMVVGLVLFIALPLILAAIAGYTGWVDRALVLTRAHAERETMRMAFHFLYPLQLYYLSGLPLVACALAGLGLLIRRPKSTPGIMAATSTNYLLLISFLVDLLFFGLFSHLQGSRVYALTLPFLVYASSVFLLWVRQAWPRCGNIALAVICLLFFGSLGYKTVDYLSKSSGLKQVSDIIARHLKRDQLILSSSGAQIFYGTRNSEFYRGISCPLKPIWPQLFLPIPEWKVDLNNPPVMVMQDGVNLAVIIHESGSRDLLQDRSIDTLRAILQSSDQISRVGDRIFAGAEDFYNSPYYYLEMLYSRRSYEFFKNLTPQARDSVFVYLFNPAKAQATLINAEDKGVP
ncbi:hypothetical protein ACFLQW_02060 [Candidatus Zixiibacteriota bacterium]